MGQKIFYKTNIIAIYLFCFFPLLPNKIKGFPVIFLFLSSFFIFFNEKKYDFPLKKVMFFSSLFLISLISIIHTENITGIESTLSTRLSLLIVPISFGLLIASGLKVKISTFILFKKMLMIVTFIFSLWILIYLLQLGIYNGKISLVKAISHITNKMWIINQHPIYTSIFISITILIVFCVRINIRTVKGLLFDVFFLLILIITLLLLSRKGPIISLLISLICLVLTNLKKIGVKKIGVFLIVIGCLLALMFSPLKSRFKEVFRTTTYSVIDKNNSTSLRFGIYNCAIRKIREAPIFGYGLGDVQVELDKCYHQNAPILTEITYNSHNQYLSYFLSSGIFGFLLLFFVMLKSIIDSIRNKNVLLLSISVFFAVCMLFENILERQSGVIVFSFYMCLFSFYNFSKPKKFELISE